MWLSINIFKKKTKNKKKTTTTTTISMIIVLFETIQPTLWNLHRTDPYLTLLVVMVAILGENRGFVSYILLCFELSRPTIFSPNGFRSTNDGGRRFRKASKAVRVSPERTSPRVASPRRSASKFRISSSDDLFRVTQLFRGQMEERSSLFRVRQSAIWVRN